MTFIRKVHFDGVLGSVIHLEEDVIWPVEVRLVAVSLFFSLIWFFQLTDANVGINIIKIKMIRKQQKEWIVEEII